MKTKISNTVSKFKQYKNSVVLSGLVALGFVQAQADALTAPTLNTADAIAVGGAVLAGLAIIWGVRAAIRMVK